MCVCVKNILEEEKQKEQRLSDKKQQLKSSSAPSQWSFALLYMRLSETEKKLIYVTTTTTILQFLPFHSVPYHIVALHFHGKSELDPLCNREKAFFTVLKFLPKKNNNKKLFMKNNILQNKIPSKTCL